MTDSTILEFSPSEETIAYLKALARQLQKKPSPPTAIA